jgi:hypothetical protein
MSGDPVGSRLAIGSIMVVEERIWRELKRRRRRRSGSGVKVKGVLCGGVIVTRDLF